MSARQTRRWHNFLFMLLLAGCATSPPPQDPNGLVSPTLGNASGAALHTLRASLAEAPHYAATLPLFSLYGDPQPVRHEPPTRRSLSDAKPIEPADVSDYARTGRASWYGTHFNGRRTANGEKYNMYAMTAAHRTLPLSSYVRVTNPSNGKSVVVRINDRGPFHRGRLIDLSYAAAGALGIRQAGTSRVTIQGLSAQEAQVAVGGEKVTSR